jgi:benzoyl-CoA reductase/2-hydroxyglutaryl-CoA dehydratase subunit BcrC/BadD/HgdB
MGLERVGMTSSVPIEVIYGAGLLPIDLNNVFITGRRPSDLISRAEEEGFPRSVCAWIKGIFAAIIQDPRLKTVIAVTQGDCSNTQALMEVLSLWGVETVPFDYPLERSPKTMKEQIERLLEQFGASWESAGAAKKRLDFIRRKLLRLDELTWKENKIRGAENHLFLVSSSDFDSDPDSFESKLDEALKTAVSRTPLKEDVRLGYVGVPPIFSDLYDFVESLGARVVFNEIQRQFSMPYLTNDLVEQYLLYTYPYDIFSRINDIQHAIRQRNLDGIIHYTQSFCHRQIQDLVLRKKLDIPILTIEGEDPGPIDGRLKVRIEAFIDMLR